MKDGKNVSVMCLSFKTVATRKNRKINWKMFIAIFHKYTVEFEKSIKNQVINGSE